jgi:hypothetical protein
LPITITGKRDSPTLGVSAFHKTFKKSLGGDDKGDASGDGDKSKGQDPNDKDKNAKPPKDAAKP